MRWKMMERTEEKLKTIGKKENLKDIGIDC